MVGVVVVVGVVDVVSVWLSWWWRDFDNKGALYKQKEFIKVS